MKDLFQGLSLYEPNTSGVSRQSAVLIPLIKLQGEYHLVFEVRAHTLRTQPGEICFPGGQLDRHEDPKEAAIRETCEELHIEPERIEIIGQLDSILTQFDMLIHCYVGIIDSDFNTISPNPSEVHKLFTVPLNHLRHQTPAAYTMQTAYKVPTNFPFNDIPDGKDYQFKQRHNQILFYKYKHYTIWGLTAIMIQNLCQVLTDTLK